MAGPPKSERNQTQTEVPITIESLLEPGGVESLVTSGRVPLLIEYRGRNVFTIPPVETPFDDIINHIPGVEEENPGSVIFRAPDGQIRGQVPLAIIPKDQAKQLSIRVDSALEELVKKNNATTSEV